MESCAVIDGNLLDADEAKKNKPYDLTTELSEAKKTKTYKLAPSIWSAALVLPLAHSSKISKPNDFFLLALPSMIHVCILVTIQSFFVKKISDMWDETNFDCSEEPITLNGYLCVGCLVLYVLAGDVCDSVTAFGWILRIPQYDKDSNEARLVFQNGKPLFGMTWKYRLYAVGLVLSRIGINFVVLAYGSLYVLSDETAEGKILRSLSMVFLVELDDISYRLLQPDVVKQKLEEMPAIEDRLTFDSDGKAWDNMFVESWGIISMFMLVSVSTFLVQGWCNQENWIVVAVFGLPSFVFVSGSSYFVLKLHRCDRKPVNRASVAMKQVSPEPAQASVSPAPKTAEPKAEGYKNNQGEVATLVSKGPNQLRVAAREPDPVQAFSRQTASVCIRSGDATT